MQRPANLKVGDKFVSIEDRCNYANGDILTLYIDDGSTIPWLTGSSKRQCEVCADFQYLKPYSSITRFGGRIDGNTVTVHIGKSEGKAVYNPDDEKKGLPFRPEIGIAIAYMRASGVTDDEVDIFTDRLLHAHSKPAPKAEEAPKQDGFKVGETVRILANFKNDYSISHDTLSAMNGKTAMVEVVQDNGACHLKNIGYIWPAYMLRHINTPNSVTIDGVRYVPEK